MPSAKSTNPAPRKRTRKRKRRAVSASSSSSSSQPSSSSEEESSSDTVRKVETPRPAVSSESESDSDSDTSNSSSSIVIPSKDGLTPSQKPNKVHRSPSPSPPPVEIPSFLPPRRDASAEEKEKELKDKFRKFWMSSVADGFRDDLEELRKEPNLGTGRLALLIDSLASGSEVFSSGADSSVSEMDMMMES